MEFQSLKIVGCPKCGEDFPESFNGSVEEQEIGDMCPACEDARLIRVVDISYRKGWEVVMNLRKEEP